MQRAALIALDWGTTSLRASLLDDTGRVIDLAGGRVGILKVPAGDFPRTFDSIIGRWLHCHGKLPVLACGMVGSRQGWLEAPYAPVPCKAADLMSRLVVAPGAEVPVTLVPGIAWQPEKGAPDVMRGEETQVFGALADADGSGIYVLPGTHSKWVQVEAGTIVRFVTYMTGEVYALLCEHSILGRTMERDAVHDPVAFREGVLRGLDSDELLHRLFEVRTMGLFDRLSPTAAPSWLSGLLLGSEIGAARRSFGNGPVVLIGAVELVERYWQALCFAGIAAETADKDVTVRGLWRIAQAAGMVST